MSRSKLLHCGHVGLRRRLSDRPDLGSALWRPVLRGQPPGARDRRDQRARAGCRRVLGRSHHLRLPPRVPHCARVHGSARLRVDRRRARKPRLAQRRVRALRGDVRRAQLRAAQERRRDRRVDSSEPDLDHGQIGRGRYLWIEEQFSQEPSDLKIFVLHHHLLPVPGTGRERNVVYDAGDAIECLQRAGVRLVLSGHKHVPYVWRLEDLFVVNAGPSRRCVCGGTRGPVTTSSRSRTARSTSGAGIRSTARSSSSPSRSTRSSTRSSRARSRTRSPPRREGPRSRRRRALSARRPRRARRASLRLRRSGSRRRDGEAARRTRATACRSPRTSTSALERYRPEVVVDLSDEPVLGPVERFALASRVLDPRNPVRRRGLPVRPADDSSPSSSPRSRSSARASASARPRLPGTSRGCSPAESRVVVVAMGRGGPAEPETITRAADARRARRALASRTPRCIRPSRDGRARRCRDGGLPALRRRARRRRLRVERPRGSARGRRARTRISSSSTAAARRCLRSPPTGRSPSSAATRAPPSRPGI